MASKPKLRWVEEDKGPKCHAHRCDALQVKNRLCNHHNAMWLTQGQQPPMPDYDHPQKGVKESMEEEAKALKKLSIAITRAPMMSMKDAQRMEDWYNQALEKVELLSDARQSAVRPLIAAVKEILSAYEPLASEYRKTARICLARVKDYEQRNDVVVIDDREPPAHSGFLRKIPGLDEVVKAIGDDS